jgi:RNA polymerase sigma factor (sigma-70 family)
MEPLAFPRAAPPPAEAAPAVVPLALPMNPPPPAPTLAALFEAEESGLLRFALGLTGRRAVAEELVQEAFLRLHALGAQVENPRAWLYQSVRNLALNHLRDHRRESPLAGTAEADTTPADTDLPPEELGRMEALGLVRMLLAEMPPEDRRLLLMKYSTELKYKEISEQTGLSVGHVGYKLHHLLKTLAESLRRAGVEGSTG